jgi:hypothetical protein
MGCTDCDKKVPRELLPIVGRFDIAAIRRATCGRCDKAVDGTCSLTGADIKSQTKLLSQACPIGKYGAARGTCPSCSRPKQFLTDYGDCQWCEIARKNKERNQKHTKRPPAKRRLSSFEMSPIEPSSNLTGGDSVVWVYWAGGQKNNELWYSLRLAQKHIKDSGDLFLCGDIPDWYLGNAIPSPRVSDEDAVKRIGSTTYKKWLDSIIKLQAIIDDPRVSERFLWMYDDTFVVRQTTIQSLAVPRYKGSLTDGGNSSWRRVRKKTASVLSGAGMPIRDYSTHYPIVYEKQKLQQTIDRFRPDKIPTVIESLYHNQWASAPQRRGSELEYVHRVRCGWTPRANAVVANVGEFTECARAAIHPLIG